MSVAEPQLHRAVDAMRRNDFSGALAAAEEGLEASPHDPALLGLAALTALRVGRSADAERYLRRQLDVTPHDRAAQFNLATLLAGEGKHAEALGLASDYAGHSKLARLAGYLYQQEGNLAAACEAYEAAVAISPDDWESWNNLGNCRAGAEQREGAIAAFEAAINCAPGGGIPQMFLNLSEVLRAPEDKERRLRTAEEAARRFPEDHSVQIELGLAQAASDLLEFAEATLRKAATHEDTFGEARLELGLLFEAANRLDELDAHVAECEKLAPGPELNFLRAWSLRRRERFDEARVYADLIPGTINPIRTAQLRAEIADRLGESDEAIRQYELMNRASVAAQPKPSGPTYRERVEAQTASMTEPLPPVPIMADAPRDPVFIVGSPRSGTTLLDTLLMALPELQVLEEQPMLETVEAEFPGLVQEVDVNRIMAARARYFELAAQIEGPTYGRRVVDKMPLHMTHMPVIHRLFPDASIVLAERHPCDAVLSCYMANFTLNPAMRSYTDLEEAARTYSAVFANWRRASDLLPLKVHKVRYERMIADLAGEMRPLLSFLGLPWRDEVLDNQAIAAKRGVVRTASYAQIGQPLYKRAIGRWERYGNALKPVLPILQPWIDWLDY